MKKYFILLLLSYISVVSTAQKLVKVGDGYSSTSVNTTIFRNNSIVTHKGNQYISFYDAEGWLTIGKRKLGSQNWTLSRSQYRGKVSDAHNIISMMADGEGYLHVAFDHHGNRLNYCRSVAPESIQLAQKESMIAKDEEDVTYPEFYRLPSGDLLFAYRSGASGRGNLVLNRYSLNEHKWSRVQDILIDGENQRNAYWQMYVDKSGIIHLSWVWRETWMVETNHDMCYACSKDGGESWERSDGTKYQLPINAANAEYAWRIPQNHELINQTSMSADAQGNPYIATYWRDGNDSIPQFRMIWNEKGKWHCDIVGNRTTPFSLKGGGTKMIPISRPRMVVDGNRAFYIFRDMERGSKASLAYKNDIHNGSEQWTVIDLTDFSLNAWEPSYDSELWKKNKKLHIYIQQTNQGDGEKSVESAPTAVYVLEIDNLKRIIK
ncbi:BNR repeat-containing protein [Phocaeicola paurosaccharolyticus]|uniref:BNR repeat-containing protein n=1 Tax=Phocaeicola paurosaccharolyticus TaxID=732242 RepID=UPI002FE03B26